MSILPNEITAAENDDPFDDEKLPSYRDPGVIFFRLLNHNLPGDTYKFEAEIIDYTGSSFWIQEGEGFDYWLDHHFTPEEMPEPGLYIIENVIGVVHRGDGWTTDDDVDWEFDPVRRATPDEVAKYDCLRLFNAQAENAEPDWNRFAHLEIGGCVDAADFDPAVPGSISVNGGQSAARAEYFTIYGRLHDGVAEAITDCHEGLAAADEIAAELAQRAGLSVVDDLALDRDGGAPAPTP